MEEKQPQFNSAKDDQAASHRIAQRRNVDSGAAFSRGALNGLILVTLLLVVLLNLPFQSKQPPPLPTPPLLDIHSWQTDGGSQVWFHPFINGQIQLHIWYPAGFARPDGEPGTAYLLAQSMKWQANQQSLPVKIRLDADFLKLEIQLPTEPSQLPVNIRALQQWLYRPALPAALISQLRTGASQSLTDQLAAGLYEHSAYGRSRMGTPLELTQRTRLDVQQFHHAWVHPQLASVALVGDLSIEAARVLTETLLPQSPQPVSIARTEVTQNFDIFQQGNIAMLSWPPLSPDSFTSITLAHQLLQTIHQEQIKLKPGLVNSTLIIHGFSALQEELKVLVQADGDSDMIARAQRQLAQKWIDQTYDADRLCQLLIHIQAYRLGINHFSERFTQLNRLREEGGWQTLKNQLLVPIQHYGKTPR